MCDIWFVNKAEKIKFCMLWLTLTVPYTWVRDNTPFSREWKTSFKQPDITFIFNFSLLFPRKKTNGYISQPLINTAKKTKHQWYNFQLQTAPSKVRSIARFNTSIHPHIKLYQDSKTPLLLKDVIVKEDESDRLFNQQSTSYLPCKF